MKKTLAIILLLVFLVSCSKAPVGMSLEETIKQSFESENKVITMDELVQEKWDSAWLVNGFDKDAALPQELASLEPSESSRLILIQGDKLTAFDTQGAAEIIYPKSFYLTAVEVHADDEFLIDKLGEDYRLIYQEGGEEHCPV